MRMRVCKPWHTKLPAPVNRFIGRKKRAERAFAGICDYPAVNLNNRVLNESKRRVKALYEPDILNKSLNFDNLPRRQSRVFIIR